MVKADKDLKEDGILLQKRREFTKVFQFTRNPNFGVAQITTSPITHPTRSSGALISITCMFDSCKQNQRVEGSLEGRKDVGKCTQVSNSKGRHAKKAEASYTQREETVRVHHQMGKQT